MNRLSRFAWEKNGNFEENDGVGGGSHVMEKPLPLSSPKFSCQNADLNSNQILVSDTQGEETENKRTDKSTLNQNRRNSRDKCSTLNSPTNNFGTSLHQKDLSYDDLSKNIDANLAEIDMETFRSEDINSILALPAIYSGHFDSINHGEQCASVSGSLLNGLEIETSVRSINRISEDEISICKDEPLFSPQREPINHERTISVDGLDNSSSYDQDLVLTCKANKNNYTIVFEGSETQFSEDSQDHYVFRSSEAVSSASEEISNDILYTSSSMIQSDLVFTTWSNLKQAHIGKKRRKFLQESSIKSKSLPNLNYQSALLNDKVLQWAKTRGNKNSSFLPELEFLPPSNLHILRKCGYPYALSLVKLFMKYKVSSRSSVLSSEHSSSTNSLTVHSLNNINHSSLNSTSKIELKEYKESEADLANQNYNIKNHIGLENLNTNQKRQLYVDNAKVLDWHSASKTVESNNNTTNSLKSFPASGKLHTNNIKDGNVITPSGECDNSQYFEDSLMEAPILQVKNFNAMPIKEEEETDISSGDEVMKTSMSSDCNNCSSASIDAAIIKNNALDMGSRQDVEHNLDRIVNIFPSCKINAAPSSQAVAEVSTNQTDARENQTQATQTKHFNSSIKCNDSTKILGKQVCVRPSSGSSGSREPSPNSSGYLSSRHSSIERLQRSSLSSGEAIANAKNILLTTTRNCSTQVPVHVKDCCMQTSTFTSSLPNAGFLLTTSLTDEIPRMETFAEQAAKSEHTCNCASNKPLAHKDKCIYVCFPNYSLPDLSFLKSVSSNNSTSVFLSPTKFKPSSKTMQTPFNKPKSAEKLDSKRLSNIKDWESLSVLLPDDMKHLLSEMKLKNDKESSLTASHGLSESKSFPNSKIDLSNNFEGEKCKSPSNPLRQCSFNLRNRNVPHLDNSHYNASWKGYSQESVKSKLSQCICQHCVQDGSISKDQSAISQDFFAKQVTHRNLYKMAECFDSKCGSFTKPENPYSRHSVQKQFTPVFNPEDMKKEAGSRQHVLHVNKSPRHLSNSNHSTVKISHKSKTSSAFVPEKEDNSQYRNINRNMESGQNEPSYHDDQADRRNSTVRFDQRQKECDRIDSDDFFDLEKAPQEFLVSPVQNASYYPSTPDSYQNLSGNGNTIFQDSLKRKTGLVENLQKATSLIIEDHAKTFKHDSSCCTSISVGQKILTALCPAVHTILSDGLLPSVHGFFGPLPNSPWKVTEASVQLDDSKKEVQELLKHVNSEKLLTDSTYRFNAFIMGLLNLGSLEWWLGHVMSSQSLISHHYHPTALLSLLALPASSHLKHELLELVNPLTSLSFNLDLAFEARIAVAASKAHENNYCKTKKNKHVDDHRIQNFNLQTQIHKCNRDDINSNVDLLHSVKNQNKGHIQELPVWPGITINPFPNAHLADEADHLNLSPRKVCHSKMQEHKMYAGLKDKTMVKQIADLSLCSSTDSGCSSRVGQSHDVSSAATDSGESESQASVKPDGQQFRKLQQKWEKITLGIEKPPQPKNPTNANAGLNKKSADAHSKKSSRCQARVNSAVDESLKNAKATKRAVSQPPNNKQHSRTETDRKLQTPDVIPSTKINNERKNRSHIPTLKGPKNLQGKSKIPVQKTGTRIQSTNRDAKNLS